MWSTPQRAHDTTTYRTCSRYKLARSPASRVAKSKAASREPRAISDPVTAAAAADAVISVGSSTVKRPSLHETLGVFRKRPRAWYLFEEKRSGGLWFSSVFCHVEQHPHHLTHKNISRASPHDRCLTSGLFPTETTTLYAQFYVCCTYDAARVSYC